jgi:hypothetical protein
MEKSQKSEERELAPTVTPRPREETTRIRLVLEELEARLAPQSSTSILD